MRLAEGRDPGNEVIHFRRVIGDTCCESYKSEKIQVLLFPVGENIDDLFASLQDCNWMLLC